MLETTAHDAEGSNEVEGVWQDSAPAMLRYPQLAFVVEMGDIEAPNPRTVEAKRKAEWPPQGLATEHSHGPDQPPREVKYDCDANTLKR